jgi:hypothetical protein
MTTRPKSRYIAVPVACLVALAGAGHSASADAGGAAAEQPHLKGAVVFYDRQPPVRRAIPRSDLDRQASRPGSHGADIPLHGPAARREHRQGTCATARVQRSQRLPGMTAGGVALLGPLSVFDPDTTS